MAIDKNNIEKYIFDPDNPRKCKSYSLLLWIAKREHYTFISPEFLFYFFREQIINRDFDEAIWDKPKDYNKLNIFQKLELYEKNLSKNDLLHYLKEVFNKIDLKKSLLVQNKIFKNKVFIYCESSFPYKNYICVNIKQIENIEDIKYIVSTKDNKLIENIVPYDVFSTEFSTEEYYNNYIFFSKNYFDILKFNITKASIFITLKENIEKFLQENKNKNIKPLFLKKIEDIDILLNILEEDLKKEKYKQFQQDKIEYLDRVDIKNFFSIKDITLHNLKNRKEIYIVGENGDGKTLLLQAIAIGLKGTKEDGLKEFREREDEFRIEIDNRDKIRNNFFAYGSSRNDNCKLKEDREGYLTLFSGEYDLKSPIKWLQYLDYSEQKGDSKSSISVKKAKKILQHLLNREIDIEISPKEVVFKEKGSKVSFEQLSSGYRSVITIICDLVARLSEKQKVENIEDFRGVVLIDEVELHLHPKWQYSFIKKLRETFPKIQFIVTTHSPTVLLGASVDAIYFNIYKESGVIKISEQKSIKNDFLNDIQSSIFGFDVDWERVDNPSSDDTNRHNLAKENLLNLIKKIDGEN